MKKSTFAFTLAELLVAISVLALIIVLIAQLANSAARVTTLANKRIDADSTVRPFFDRMALDFEQMIKRRDVSYYFKNAADTMSGNDLMAFYSGVPGYSASTPSPVSVVAYRINSDSTQAAYNCLERMGRGLPWNGSSGSDAPITFLPLTLDAVWPSVVSSANYDSTDPHSITYEIIGPRIFRLEYYFLDTNGSLLTFPASWTTLPAVNFDAVAAIVVAIATIDPKSKVLLSTSQLDTLRQRLPDYNGEGPGGLIASWQTILDQTADMPRPTISGVRLYERYFSFK